jgi:hypothetical protein
LKGSVIMSERLIARIVWVITALVLAANVYALWRALDAGTFDTTPVSILGAIAWGLLPMVFVLIGALIVSRQPKNIIGWLLMLPVLVFVLDEALFNLPEVAPTALDVGLWLQLWFDNWSWVLLIFPLFHLLLVFPTGRLPSPRWRWVVGLELVMATTMMVGAAFGEEIGPLNVEGANAWTLPNPIGFLPGRAFGATFLVVWTIALLTMTVMSLASVVVRFRRATPIERQQLKWLFFAFGVFALVYGVGAATAGGVASGSWGDLVFALSVMGIPVSIGIAILRHRLFDIDLIIRRTLLYAVITGLLVGVYALSVFVLQNLVGGVVGENSPLTVAVSTLLIAALFNPLRRRLQDVIDRRLYRSKYDAQKVVDEFVARARDEADMNRLSANLLHLVEQTVRPAVEGLWVKGAESPTSPGVPHQA